jgi:hypothetical protein
MADTFSDLSLPDSQEYRIVGVGASYYAPMKTIGPDGKPTVVYVYQFATRGQTVQLTEDQAERLEGLGAVKPYDEPKSYDEMDETELRQLSGERGLRIVSSGADPDQPLRQDYVQALKTYDTGADAGVVGAASAPGGVVTVGPAEIERAGDFDATGKSATEVSDWISSERPNASRTVAAAQGDPETARVVLEAESSAHNGDPRATVTRQLEKIIGPEQQEPPAGQEPEKEAGE